MTGRAISMDTFSFSYERSDEWQLRRITINVERGERVAIMGATGSGKSTMAMSINGLIPHHHEGQVHGAVIVGGVDVHAADPVDVVRIVGLVMQDPETQITGQTALGDATVGPANFGLPLPEVLSRARAALELVGLGALGDRATDQLSGGQKQRLAVAGVLAMDSEILVLDEPTSELDPQGTAEIFDIVAALSAEQTKTIVLIEHEPELVAGWADRLLVIDVGRIVYDGDPAAFFSNRDAAAHAGIRLPHVADIALRMAAAGRTGTTDEQRVPIIPADAIKTLERWTPDHPSGPKPGAPGTPPSPDTHRTSNAPGPIIEVRDLVHVYPSGVAALTNVSVTVNEGEFVAVLGRNGAGKTTFARHLNGLLRPTAGSIMIGGRDTAGRRIADLAADVGYVFQNPDHQIFANSVHDEVAYGLRNAGRSSAEIDTRVHEVLAQVGMAELAGQHPFGLGKGQRQRLAVASVLALSPRVLVIDEPTTGQDWRGARAMMALVDQLNRASHTILMITHDMTLVAEYARRALVFADGRIVADTDPHSLFGDEDLLKRCDLSAPQVTTLAAALGCPHVVTTVEEFAEQWGLAVPNAV